MRSKFIFTSAVAVCALMALIWLRPHPATAPKTSKVTKPSHSLTDPASIWVVVNKQHPLEPKTYTPSDLVIPAIPLRTNITDTESFVSQKIAPSLEELIKAANRNGLNMNLQSGYRSYDFQVSLYNTYVEQQGKVEADTQSARPGYSEHQTGLSVDVGSTSEPGCNVADCFADTPEGKWLAAHAYTYGFIIRYPSDKQQITGYKYEPWHIRFVGTELAMNMHNKGIETLEEYFKLGSAADY